MSFCLKKHTFRCVFAYRPHYNDRKRWSFSSKMHTFESAVQSGDIWKRRLLKTLTSFTSQTSRARLFVACADDFCSVFEHIRSVLVWTGKRCENNSVDAELLMRSNNGAIQSKTQGLRHQTSPSLAFEVQTWKFYQRIPKKQRWNYTHGNNMQLPEVREKVRVNEAWGWILSHRRTVMHMDVIARSADISDSLPKIADDHPRQLMLFFMVFGICKLQFLQYIMLCLFAEIFQRRARS